MTASAEASANLQHETECCLLLLCGVPGAGKTTLARHLISKRNHDGWIFVHICLDDFYPKDTRSLSPGESVHPFAMKEQRQSVNKCIEQCLMRTFSQRTKEGHSMKICNEELLAKFCDSVNRSSSNVVVDCDGRLQLLPSTKFVLVVDDNLPLRSMRHEYYQLAREYEIGFCTVFLSCYYDAAKLRNSQRSSSVPISTIETMLAQFEPPDSAKLHWERYSLVVDSTNWVTEDCYDTIWTELKQVCVEAISNPVHCQPMEDLALKESCRQINLDNVVHQADKVLRQCVSKAVKDRQTQGVEIALYAKKVNAVRKGLLEQLRSGNMEGLEWHMSTLETTNSPEFRSVVELKFQMSLDNLINP